MESEQFDSQPLSPEQMRLESEILKLRLQAEFGSLVPDADICAIRCRNTPS